MQGFSAVVGAEERLILACVRVDGTAPTAARALLAGGPIDWARVIDRADTQAVLPLVHRALAPHASELPPSAAVALRELALEEARESLRQAEALRTTLDTLERAGVRALPFKGPTLAVQAYGDLGARAFADLDLLVRLEDLPSAREALLDAGYRPSYPTTAARRALLVRRGSHESLESSDDIAIELHWRIASPVSDFALDYERLWGRIVSLQVAGAPVPILPPDDLLLVLCLHGTKHAWERLSWICDVAHLLRAAPDLDWGTLLGEAERMRCRRVVLLGLHLAARVGGGPLPQDVVHLIEADRSLPPLAAHVLSGLFHPPRSGAGTFRFHLGTRERAADKLALALGSLTALNQHDLDVIRLPDAALPLYYLTRPLRLVGKSLAHLFRSGARPGVRP